MAKTTNLRVENLEEMRNFIRIRKNVQIEFGVDFNDKKPDRSLSERNSNAKAISKKMRKINSFRTKSFNEYLKYVKREQFLEEAEIEEEFCR